MKTSRRRKGTLLKSLRNPIVRKSKPKKKNGKFYTGDYIPKNKHKYVGEYPITYRSGYEEAFMVILDFDDSVKDWNFECIKIPYTHMDEEKNYLPDFLVNYHDGKTVLFEVKPYKISEEAIDAMSKGYFGNMNAAKWLGAMKYCREHDIIFTIKTERGIFANHNRDKLVSKSFINSNKKWFNEQNKRQNKRLI